jgi:HNH endonuclease
MTPTLEWFMRRVDVTDGCWFWRGAHTPTGYGSVTWKEDGKQRGTPAHRMAYRLCFGNPDPDKQIHHTCGTRDCVRPGHLEELTRNEHTREHAFMKDPVLRSMWDELEATGTLSDDWTGVS